MYTKRERNIRNAVGASASTLGFLAQLMKAAANGDKQASEDLAHFVKDGRLGITLDAYLEEALGLTPYLELMEGK